MAFGGNTGGGGDAGFSMGGDAGFELPLFDFGFAEEDARSFLVVGYGTRADEVADVVDGHSEHGGDLAHVKHVFHSDYEHGFHALEGLLDFVHRADVAFEFL